MDSLFSGIKDKKESDSDSSDDGKEDANLKSPINPAEKQQPDVADLLSFGTDSQPAAQQQQPVDVLGDLLGGGPAQPVAAPSGPAYAPLPIETP